MTSPRSPRPGRWPGGSRVRACSWCRTAVTSPASTSPFGHQRVGSSANSFGPNSPEPPAVRRSRRSLRLRGADVSGESLSWRAARIARLLTLVLVVGIAAAVVAGCGGSDKTDSISSEAQKRIEKGSEEAQKGIEKAKEE